MKTLILASAATLMIAGSAFAQEAPATIYGNGSPAAERASGAAEQVTNEVELPSMGIDRMPTASVEEPRNDGAITLEDVTNPTSNDNISGK